MIKAGKKWGWTKSGETIVGFFVGILTKASMAEGIQIQNLELWLVKGVRTEISRIIWGPQKWSTQMIVPLTKIKGR